MAFAWIPDAIPNLLIGLFLCGLSARLWRLRGSRVGRPLIAVASVLAVFTTLLSVGILIAGFDSAARATGLAMASGVLPLAAALALASATLGLRRLGLLDEVRVERVGVIENLSDGVVLLDKQDNLVALNRTAHRVLNLREVAPLGQSVLTLLVEFPALSKLLIHSKAGRTEIESCNESGEASIYDVEVSPVIERGANAGRAIVLRDVTPSKRAEEVLEREAKRVALLLEVERAVAATNTVESALEAGLETICRAMGWPLGHVYQPWEGDRPELCSASIDYTEEVGVYDALIEAIGASGFAPRCGTPGRAWWTHEVEQIDDLSSDSSHPRNAVASEFGLSSALAVPILIDIEVVAVLEFLAPSMSDLDERTVEILKHSAGSLGRSIALHRANLQIRGLEYFDGLTGLPNRELFRERLQARLEDESARDQNMAVLFVDIDGFRQVNESLGYVAGDQVLREVARRFHKLTRLTDVVSRGDLPDPANSSVSLSRLGGDEFLLLLNKLESPGDASHVAARLVAGLFEPIVVLDREVMVGASVGIAIYPDDGQDAESLICAADEAMSTAKSHGGNAYRFYADTMNHLSVRQLHLEHRLREAASREDWTLHYQPVRNAPTGRVRAVEALLRWDYPDLGLVTPSEFLQVAEDIGLSSSIGDWVLREACFQAARWRDEGFAGIRIAVNVSPRQIREGDLVAGVVSALENAGVSGDQLELEINENSILQDEERSRYVLEAIRELGVTVALDRFGTGYSSVTHLRDFPIDRLKVDRSLVSQMEADPSKAAIVRAIIGLARQLEIEVVAEGVENESELRLLRAEGCDDLQGYLFSKPLPADQITRFFEREKAEDSDTL